MKCWREGIHKKDLTREEFLKHAWEWKEKYGGIILSQLKKLGCSCDWERTNFTMNPSYYDSVIKVFVDLFNDGKIYRGVRMVNWDPKRKTALSDEEVYHKEVNSKLYYLAYAIEGSDEKITIATTRPETILGDTAICVHPEDERYTHLKGKKAIVPMVNRAIPIIFDEYVDKEFGTGSLKVTPAHDINDYNLGIKHNLETIEILDDSGCLNENAQFYIGEDRFVVRKKIAKDLDEAGILVKVEDIQNKVACSERSHAVIEPKLSMQWFCKMEELAKPALDAIKNEEIKLVPKNLENTYNHWMENIKDWCVSRQLWWGHRIPAFYYGSNTNDYVVAETAEKALELAKEKSGNASLTVADLKQDEDVMDTWFSSWIWPQASFNGILDPENEEFKYYFPTDVLVTGQDIIFFWVARMIMSGYYFDQSRPFQDVYFTGMVRDEKGRKMSKSLGNSPDLLKLIEKYSADGVRAGVLYSSPAGNDLLFAEKQCEQGRNFANKIWNAFRLVKGWEHEGELRDYESIAITAFENKIQAALAEVNDLIEKYRLSDAFMQLYKLIWDDFCSWYLEGVKPAFGEKISTPAYEASIGFFETLMKMLHPYMPFITEEIYQLIAERGVKDSIMMSDWPTLTNVDQSIVKQANAAEELISQVRKIRNQHGISPKDAVALSAKVQSAEAWNQFAPMVMKLANLSEFNIVTSQPESTQQFMVGTDEFFFPVEIDVNAERERLEKELNYNKGFLNGVMKKLGNEKFMAGAPEQVVAAEMKKKADAEEKIKSIEESLAQLG